MNNYASRVALGVLVILAFGGSALSVFASETTGTLSQPQVSTGINGTVATPTPPPSGGGGGGGGNSLLLTPTPTPPGTSNQPADIDQDGVLDLLDFNILITNWGSSPADTRADLNRDGVVDIFDFNLMIAAWTL